MNIQSGERVLRPRCGKVSNGRFMNALETQLEQNVNPCDKENHLVGSIFMANIDS